MISSLFHGLFTIVFFSFRYLCYWFFIEFHYSQITCVYDLNYLNLLKFDSLECFNLIDKYSVCIWKSIFSVVGLCVLKMSVRTSCLRELFRSSMSLLNFFLSTCFCQLLTGGGVVVLKFLTIIVDLSIFAVLSDFASCILKLC